MATEKVTDRFVDTINHIPERVQQVMTVLGALDAIRQGASEPICRCGRSAQRRIADLESRCNALCKRIMKLKSTSKRQLLELEVRSNVGGSCQLASQVRFDRSSMGSSLRFCAFLISR